MNLFKPLLGLSFIASLSSSAQSSLTVKDAELSFARMALETNTKKAFLSNLDSTGVVFNGGRILNGLRVWNRLPEEGPKLLWAPAMSLMSSDGGLGFTSGPFEVRNTLSDTVSGSGQYTTVWKKNSHGEWKVLADQGIGYEPSTFPSQKLRAVAEKLVSDDTLTNLMAIELAFNAAFMQKGYEAYVPVVSENFLLNRNGRHPVQNKKAVIDELRSLPQDIRFLPSAAGLSQARDLGYVYGQVQSDGKTENYLRIWGHTKKGWLILAQVVTM